MRRTKEFWARLTKEERSYLVYIEKNKNNYNWMGGYLPDDCSECVVCGLPMLGSGMCHHCYEDYVSLVNKGSGKNV